MANITEKLGNRIEKLRKRQGMTQEELAAKAHLDLTTVSEIESGSRNPSVKTIYKIALALKEDLSELFNL